LLRAVVLFSSLAGFGEDVNHELAADHSPLQLMQTYPLPGEMKGNFDHLKVHLKRIRLVGTKTPLVFELLLRISY
jgi:hypothetical protein